MYCTMHVRWRSSVEESLHRWELSSWAFGGIACTCTRTCWVAYLKAKAEGEGGEEENCLSWATAIILQVFIRPWKKVFLSASQFS